MITECRSSLHDNLPQGPSARGSMVPRKRHDTQPEAHEGSRDPASLTSRLRHVYWIGGASGSGKSTIARRLADKHGLRLRLAGRL
jgi:polynucleotide 5'-kinase involved in rRNA processing